jgi:hypothetical protein
MKTRSETDFLGEKQIPAAALWEFIQPEQLKIFQSQAE